MTVERIHPKAPVMLIFIAIFTCLPSCINLSNIDSQISTPRALTNNVFMTRFPISITYNSLVQFLLLYSIIYRLKIAVEILKWIMRLVLIRRKQTV